MPKRLERLLVNRFDVHCLITYTADIVLAMMSKEHKVISGNMCNDHTPIKVTPMVLSYLYTGALTGSSDILWGRLQLGQETEC